ncbi:Autophagy-related 16 [Hyphodiscus hymeniophilus]|uniref:Autophagy-related 16 n=1 Tax=Hyphodiscus hymeniophilus TaxID=353542 RepID=A0A9P7AX69_9HELO|nr:Autophagy-related 16 [Hyphodiscus hymeniophilus]
MAHSWREEYVQALHERDKREKASYGRLDSKFIEAYRTAALEAEKTANVTAKDPSPINPSLPPTSNDGTAQLRSDLAEALRSNGTLQGRIKAAETELVKLRVKAKVDSKTIQDLTRKEAVLAQKVRDRDEELKGKGGLLESVQDEMISLNLQLNMSEKTAKKLKEENKELIDRWMARIGHEADEMNKTLG